MTVEAGAPWTEQVTGRLHPALAPFVDSCVGYRYEGGAPGVHAGLPSRTLTCILTLDPPLDLARLPDGTEPTAAFDTVVGGLHASPAVIRHDGRQHGIQLAFTPEGARALLGMPPGELAGTVVPFDDVLPSARELLDRVRTATSWADRIAAIDDVLLRALRDPAPVTPEVRAAWDALAASDGTVAVGDVARDVGWSRRHLTERFALEYGLTPKTVARVMRFERSRRFVASPDVALADVAAACGYADQSHLTREWTELAGTTPGAWRAGDELAFVQDPPDVVGAR